MCNGVGVGSPAPASFDLLKLSSELPVAALSSFEAVSQIALLS